MPQTHKPYQTCSGKVLSESDWQHFFGDEGLWKNTEHPQDRGESPTVSTIVHHHIEEKVEPPEPKYGFYYDIASVRGFHGKGFMPKARHSDGSSRGNGNVYYGTDARPY